MKQFFSAFFIAKTIESISKSKIKLKLFKMFPFKFTFECENANLQFDDVKFQFVKLLILNQNY